CCPHFLFFLSSILVTLPSSLFSLSSSALHPALHSFPTRRSSDLFRDTRSSSCPQTARVPSPRRPRVRGQAPERVRLSSSSPPAPPGRRRLWPCPPAP